jgi:hypothetical protein
MNEQNADFLVGLMLGGFVACLLGYAGIRSIISGSRGKAKKNSRFYNTFGIITGAIIVIWVLFMFGVIGYLWLKSQ